MIAERLGWDIVLLFQHDAYYRELPGLSYDQRSAVNFDHPDALDAELCAAQLEALRGGASVRQPVYDFSTHLRKAETLRLDPKPVIIVEGILALSDAGLTRQMDLRVFMDAEEHVRYSRRLGRDVRERGRTSESVRMQWEATVQPMYERFVAPSAKRAHLLVPSGEGNDLAADILTAFIITML